MSATLPFDASTLLSIDLAQDREPVERPFGFTQGHELVEWQMGVFPRPVKAKEEDEERHWRL